tara:strand:- start:409 stop:666 length:258 start_codon:yes stop_codon:yes gene_type:complete
MKITRSKLKQIIKEELEKILKEGYDLTGEAEAVVDALRIEHGEQINTLDDEELSTLAYGKAQEMQVQDTFSVAELAHDMLLVGQR